MQNEIAKAALACGRDPSSIKLVAVSKGKTVEQIEALYNEGYRDFGESRVQEVETKRAVLPQDIAWHLIGTLQIKKVPKVVGRYALIHSVDSLDLAKKLSQVSLERGLVTDVLLQVNASGEPTKHGFSLIECQEAFAELLTFSGIRMHGLMTMAPLTEDHKAIQACFSATSHLCTKLRQQYAVPSFCELSMGMSQDFELAIQSGATLLRIGTRLFSNL